MTTKRLKKPDFIYVAAQFVLFLAYIFEFSIIELPFATFFQIVGYGLLPIGIFLILIALLQLNTNLSPFPTPKNNFLGYAFLLNSIYKIGVSCLLILLFYFKSKYEEKRLEQVFESYVSYKNKTGKFFPKILLTYRKKHT